MAVRLKSKGTLSMNYSIETLISDAVDKLKGAPELAAGIKASAAKGETAYLLVQRDRQGKEAVIGIYFNAGTFEGILADLNSKAPQGVHYYTKSVPPGEFAMFDI